VFCGAETASESPRQKSVLPVRGRPLRTTSLGMALRKSISSRGNSPDASCLVSAGSDTADETLAADMNFAKGREDR
jgi:hypothetical protein